jgi:hypothetical protein
VSFPKPNISIRDNEIRIRRVPLFLSFWLSPRELSSPASMRRVHLMCRKWQEDRVLGRFARHLVERLGWTVGGNPDRSADLNYFMRDRNLLFHASSASRCRA